MTPTARLLAAALLAGRCHRHGPESKDSVVPAWCFEPAQAWTRPWLLAAAIGEVVHLSVLERADQDRYGW